MGGGGVGGGVGTTKLSLWHHLHESSTWAPFSNGCSLKFHLLSPAGSQWCCEIRVPHWTDQQDRHVGYASSSGATFPPFVSNSQNWCSMTLFLMLFDLGQQWLWFQHECEPPEGRSLGLVSQPHHRPPASWKAWAPSKRDEMYLPTCAPTQHRDRQHERG